MRTLTDDDDDSTAAGPSAGTSQQPAWMRNLLERCREWLAQLPAVCLLSHHASDQSTDKFVSQVFNTLEKQTGDNQDPLYRLFYREGSIGQRLLNQVRRDLADVIKVCEGELKQTNHLRTLISSLTKGESLDTRFGCRN